MRWKNGGGATGRAAGSGAEAGRGDAIVAFSRSNRVEFTPVLGGFAGSLAHGSAAHIRTLADAGGGLAAIVLVYASE